MKIKGTLYIISAPSGAGKTSLVEQLIKEIDDIAVSISYTTRSRRAGEVDYKNYFFIDQLTFDQMLSRGAFLEYATVYGQSYGTSREWVMEKLEQGIDIILEIDWQGAAQVRELLPDCISIFILPPSLEALHERLQKRGQDNQAIIEKRMLEAQNDISHYNEFDYLLVNEHFEKTLDDLKGIIRSGRYRLEKQVLRHADLLNNLLNGNSFTRQ
jgi:guanylate kinase